MPLVFCSQQRAKFSQVRDGTRLHTSGLQEAKQFTSRARLDIEAEKIEQREPTGKIRWVRPERLPQESFDLSAAAGAWALARDHQAQVGKPQAGRLRQFLHVHAPRQKRQPDSEPLWALHPRGALPSLVGLRLHDIKRVEITPKTPRLRSTQLKSTRQFPEAGLACFLAVTSLREIRKKKLAESQRDVARRLREEREAGRYSQYELAAELGITRAVLSNFETAQSPVSFRVGYEFCRRLDLFPAWLATGEGPQRPFVPPAELGLTAGALRPAIRRGVDFLTGFDLLLKRPLEQWRQRNPPEKLVERILEGSTISSIARRWSNAELMEHLRGMVGGLSAGDEKMRATYSRNADALLREIESRLLAQG